MKDHKDPEQTDSLAMGCIYGTVTIVVTLIFALICFGIKSFRKEELPKPVQGYNYIEFQQAGPTFEWTIVNDSLRILTITPR